VAEDISDVPRDVSQVLLKQNTCRSSPPRARTFFAAATSRFLRLPVALGV
jgi:hypothetical protein